jgi:hypothetical protein
MESRKVWDVSNLNGGRSRVRTADAPLIQPTDRDQRIPMKRPNDEVFPFARVVQWERLPLLPVDFYDDAGVQMPPSPILPLPLTPRLAKLRYS